ncbi:unnamed protein product [Notodromas monacha]|uniref:Protein stoned-B n=1 Tax=Notodromas monacha TaxID=399045 RepID=A0A7R9BH87_9CRUS|nr:unnamed protein product [Notodromas monacha]CAG0914072.1 unnamed protein product [Notodromas monacha]
MANNPFLMDDMMGGFGDASNPFLSGMSTFESEVLDIPDACNYNQDLNPFLSIIDDVGSNFVQVSQNESSLCPSVPTLKIQTTNDSPSSANGAKDLILSVTSHMDSASAALLNQMQIAKTPIPSPDAELHAALSRDSPEYGVSPDSAVVPEFQKSSFNPFACFMEEPASQQQTETFTGLPSTGTNEFGSCIASEISKPEGSDALLVDLLGDFMSGEDLPSCSPLMPTKSSLLDGDIGLSDLPTPFIATEVSVKAESPEVTKPEIVPVVETQPPTKVTPHVARPPPPKPPPPHRPPRPAAPVTPEAPKILEMPSPVVPDEVLSPKKPGSALSSNRASPVASPEIPVVSSMPSILNEPTTVSLPSQDFEEMQMHMGSGMNSERMKSAVGNFLDDEPSPVNEQHDFHSAPMVDFTTVQREPMVAPGPEVAIGRPTPAPKMDPVGLSGSIFSVPAPPVKIQMQESQDFDAFASRFENATTGNSANFIADPFGGAFGESLMSLDAETHGFETGDASADAFLALTEPPPAPRGTPMHGPSENARLQGYESSASQYDGLSPIIPMTLPGLRSSAADLDSPEATGEVQVFKNPFLAGVTPVDNDDAGRSGDSKASTPLFELDQSEPLQPFPRTTWEDGVEFISWDMQMRHPLKKKLTGQRFWKKIFVKLTQSGNIQVFNDKNDKEPVQELPLQPSYCVSEIAAQQLDQFGKIFTLKVQYVYYKERPGVRPGQVSKAERLTSRLSQFASYAIAGDLAGVKEFGSDIKKLGIPIEHTPQISELLKLGSNSYEDLKMFSFLVEEQLFKLPLHRDRSLTYKQEEIQVTLVDEVYIEQELMGHVTCNIARVRVFFLAFLSGMPEIELGLNDLDRQGKEVVGRHDILPIVTEEWIRLEDVEFHSCVQEDAFHESKSIKFIPPDATYIELLRFRVRPPKNRELPLQVEIRSDVLVPGSSGRKMGPVPCEDVAIRFPIPECWIYMFRTEKHFRYGSVKSAHRRHGKVKGLERFLGTVETMEQAMMEVSSGQAKYEHHHKAIVWRMSRLPKEGQGAYTSHTFVCRLNLTTYDSLPEHMERYCFVEFTMPATTVSHCVARSVSCNLDEPPEKYVKYLSRQEYKVAVEFTQGQEVASYLAATSVPSNTRPVSPALSATANSETKGEGDSSDSD